MCPVMKTVMNRCFVCLFLFSVTSAVFAGDFKSKIITTEPLVITVPDDHFLKITNFTQEGGTERAFVHVFLPGDSDSQNTGAANVLVATRMNVSPRANSENFPETDNRVIIAGPAQVRVPPVAGATLFITYRKVAQDGGGGGGGGGGQVTPTPFPIFPTPTPSATFPIPGG